MTQINYTDFVPTPPPVTSGTTIQTFQDPTGDMWVAKNGVANGQWFRARDVLKCYAWPTANTTITPANTFVVVSLPNPGALNDPFGMVANNQITLPFSGAWWRVNALLCSPVSTTGARMLASVFRNGGESFRIGDIWFLANQTVALAGGAVVRWNAGDYLELRVNCSIATAQYYSNYTYTFLSVAFDGMAAV